MAADVRSCEVEAVGVMGQGIKEYVVVLCDGQLKVSGLLGGVRQATQAAERMAAGLEQAAASISISDVVSVDYRSQRLVISSEKQTLVLPMLGRPGIWARQSRGVVLGTLTGRQVGESFAGLVARRAGLTAHDRGRWTQAVPGVGSPSAANLVGDDMTIRSSAHLLGRVGVGLAAMLFMILVLLKPGEVSNEWIVLASGFGAAAYTARAAAAQIRFDGRDVVVRNLAWTHRFERAEITAITTAELQGRSMFAGRPMIALAIEDPPRIHGATATTTFSSRGARRMANHAAQLAEALGVPNEATLGALSNDRLSDSGNQVFRAGRTGG